jgi:hypothetical protein
MFGSKKKPDVITSLTNKTADIIGVFFNTIEGLEDVADKARGEALDKKAEAEKLKAEALSLDLLADRNLRIAEKLNSIVEIEG